MSRTAERGKRRLCVGLGGGGHVHLTSPIVWGLNGILDAGIHKMN